MIASLNDASVMIGDVEVGVDFPGGPLRALLMNAECVAADAVAGSDEDDVLLDDWSGDDGCLALTSGSPENVA